jgi:hypothetical protein
MRVLTTAEDITPEMEPMILNTLDWFGDERLSTEEFIDRFCKDYGGEEWDIESYDNAAVRKIMREARKMRAQA